MEQPIFVETSDAGASYVFRGRVPEKLPIDRISPNQVILEQDGTDRALFTPDKDSVYWVKLGLFTILNPDEILLSQDGASRFGQLAIRYPLTFNEEIGLAIEGAWVAPPYDEREKYDKAISDYNEAIKLDPNFASAHKPGNHLS